MQINDYEGLSEHSSYLLSHLKSRSALGARPVVFADEK